MTTTASARTALRLCAAGAGLIALVLVPSSAQALEPLPLPVPVPSADPVTELLPVPLPSPSAISAPDPVQQLVPVPVSSAVASAVPAPAPAVPTVPTVPGVPAAPPVAAPAPAPATGPVTAPVKAPTAVHQNQQSAARPVAVSHAAIAAYPALRVDSLDVAPGTLNSGLAPLTAALKSGVLSSLGSPAVAQAPVAVTNAGSTRSGDPVRDSLPLAAVIAAAVLIAGGATGQAATVRARRTSA